MPDSTEPDVMEPDPIDVGAEPINPPTRAVVPPLRQPALGRFPLTRPLTRLAGADSELLYGARWDPPFYNRWEVGYFVGAGASLLAAGTMAGISSMVFASFLFANGTDPLAFLPVGIIIGLIILSIDRWLVSDSDVGVEFIPGVNRALTYASTVAKEILKLVPRLALSLILAFLFAEPLLLVLFKVDIESQLRHDYTAQVELLAADRMAEVTSIQADTVTARDDLDAARNALAPEVRERIKTLGILIDNEISVGNNTGRDSGCGDVCADLNQQRANAQAELDGIVAQFNTEHSAEISRIAAQLEALAKLSVLSPAQSVELARQECPPPMFDMEPAQPAEMPDPAVTLGLTCPELPTGVIPRMVALERLSTDGSAFVLGDGGEGQGSAEVMANIWLVRGALIVIDILPVLMKFVRGVLPKRGYYLMVSARQSQVDTEAQILRYASAQERLAAEGYRRQAAELQGELRALEFERYMKTISESRIRTGLRGIEEFVQRVLRRHRSMSQDDEVRPPRADRGDDLPPSAGEPPRTSPPSGGGGGTGHYRVDPRSMDD